MIFPVYIQADRKYGGDECDELVVEAFKNEDLDGDGRAGITIGRNSGSGNHDLWLSKKQLKRLFGLCRKLDLL